MRRLDLKSDFWRTIIGPQILIHCWGGLGSQLHAWHLLELLKLQIPNRTFGIVFHTAGITERFPEIENFLSSNEIRRVNDYDSRSPQGKGIRSHNSGAVIVVKSFTKKFLSLIGVENNQESLDKLVRVFPWTRIIRGHYSRIPINDAALSQISSKLFNSFENKSKSSYPRLVVHLRLGDLRDLADKAPIGEDSVRQVLSELSKNAPVQQVIVHSDSPELVSSFLSSSTHISLVIRDLAVTPISALLEMVEADYFIGSSSKLSLWACIFRIKLGKENIFIPTHMSDALFDLLGENSKKINYYD